MKQRFNHLTMELCQMAASDCFWGKWKRNDVLSFGEKYAGVPRHEILLRELEIWENKDLSKEVPDARLEVIDAAALWILETIDIIENGDEPDDIDEVVIRKRPDGMTGKVRDIALLCIGHQLLNHIAFLMLEPYLRAKLYPTQHASIPGRGQTKLKDQLHGFLMKDLGITIVEKTDVEHAYGTLQYTPVIDRIEQDLPKAKTLIKLLRYLGRIAPGGHLIIGGYLDAWLFNLTMAYAMEEAYKQVQIRRGKKQRYAIRIVTFMDDWATGTASPKATKRFDKAVNDYLLRQFGLKIKVSSGMIKLLPKEEEKRRKSEKYARRGCPSVDMAGFRISRTHITIRPRVFRKTRRQYMRAWREYKESGTLSEDRSHKLISYNSFLEQSDSRKFEEKYHVKELLKVAKRVIAYHDRQKTKERLEALYELRKRTEYHEARISNTGEIAGWIYPGYPGRRYYAYKGRRRHGLPI